MSEWNDFLENKNKELKRLQTKGVVNHSHFVEDDVTVKKRKGVEEK